MKGVIYAAVCFWGFGLGYIICDGNKSKPPETGVFKVGDTVILSTTRDGESGGMKTHTLTLESVNGVDFKSLPRGDWWVIRCDDSVYYFCERK